MKLRTTLRIAALFFGGALLFPVFPVFPVFPACSSKTMSGTDSNTHWLDVCTTSADCGVLSCECGVCTKRCTETSDCLGLADAVCNQASGCGDEQLVCVKRMGGSVDAGSVTPGSGGVGSSGSGGAAGASGSGGGSGAGGSGGRAGSGGGSGAGGSGGRAGSGSGGADAGSEVSVACVRAEDCALVPTVCCPLCRPAMLSERIAITATSVSGYLDAKCATAGACPPCIPSDGTIQATCAGGRCEAIDVGPYAACTKATDCKIIPKSCCACGILRTASWVAVSDADGFSKKCEVVDCAPCSDGPRHLTQDYAECRAGVCELISGG